MCLKKKGRGHHLNLQNFNMFASVYYVDSAE